MSEVKTCQLATSCLFISHAPWFLVGETELPQHQVQKPACPKAPNNRAGSSEANIWITVTVPDNAMSPVNCARTTEVGEEEVIDASAR